MQVAGGLLMALFPAPDRYLCSPTYAGGRMYLQCLPIVC